jgi:hypothetical protein
MTINSAAYFRQTLSASRVTSIVGHEFRDQLSFFPFVPYAVSLSLSVVYREMRQSKVPMYRTRAQVSTLENCKVLDGLKDIFWTAAVMADMAHATLTELNRVHSMIFDMQHQIGEQSTCSGPWAADSSTADPRQENTNQHSSAKDGYLGAAFAAPCTTLDDGWIIQDKTLLSSGESTDKDLFDLFDTDFDLENIDACLVDNLDLSVPTYF